MQRVALTLEKAASDKPNVYRLKASGPGIDRDGEVVEIDTAKVGRRMPIYRDHMRTEEGRVGSGGVEVVGKELFVDVKFLDNFYAKQIQATLDDPDHAESMGMSVGIRAAKRTLVDGVTHWTGGELMEVSFTGTPSYPDTGLSKSTDDVEKGVAGSHEDTTERIRKALRDIEASWITVRATYEKSVVYEFYDYEKGDDITVSREWSMKGGSVSLGEPTKGSLVTTFVPNSEDSSAASKAQNGSTPKTVDNSADKNADDKPAVEPPVVAAKSADLSHAAVTAMARASLALADAAL